MHILFLTDNFPPEVNAPASRTFEHCREWVKAGEQVTVITCAPNFPRGRVFDGYRNRLWQTECMAGIRVIRVWTYITANEGFGRRILDYLSFMMSAAAASLCVRRVDVVIGTSPQFFTACAAYVIGTIKRVPWVFELRDIWPESIRAVGAMRQSRLLDCLERLELWLYHRASLIVAVTKAFRDTLVRRGVDGSKISVITNGVDCGHFQPREKDAELLARHDLADKFVAGYIGTHGMAHALDTVLEAALRMRRALDGDRYRFLLIGDGAQKTALVERARKEAIANLLFVDIVSKDEVVRYWSVLDASIIHLRRTDLFKSVIPSKLFESMAMAIPVLLGVEGEAAEIVTFEGVGLTFEPENPEALCASLRRLHEDSELYDRLRRNGPLAAKHYDRAELARAMLCLIRRVVSEDLR